MTCVVAHGWAVGFEPSRAHIGNLLSKGLCHIRKFWKSYPPCESSSILNTKLAALGAPCLRHRHLDAPALRSSWHVVVVDTSSASSWHSFCLCAAYLRGMGISTKGLSPSIRNLR